MNSTPDTRTLWLDVDDGCVIYNPGTRTFIDLDERGREFWHVLERSGWSEAALTAYIVEAYDLAHSEAAEATRTFVKDLVANNALLPSSP